jgi:hypothetical protein
VTLYQILHDSIHGKSGQQAGLKLQYIRTGDESVMGWVKICNLIDFDSNLLTSCALIDNPAF